MATIEVRKTAEGAISYRVKVRLKGFPEASATFARKTDARKWAEDQAARRRSRRHFPQALAKNILVRDVLERYIIDVLPQKPRNARSQRAQLLWWKSKLGAHRLADVTPELIVRWRDELLRGATARGTTRSPATVVRYLAVLSHVFTKAHKEWGYTDANPVRDVSKPKEPRGRVRYLSKEELGTLSDACKASRNLYLYTIFVLAVSTGMRLGEIRNLRKSDIDLQHTRLILHGTKNGERRGVPLAALALQLVRQRLALLQAPGDLLFPGAKPDRPI